MKKHAALLLALAMCLSLLAACGGGNDAVDPGFDNVVAAVEGAVSTDGMAQMDANYIENMFKLTTDDYEQALVMATNVGTTIDEFGLFKGAGCRNTCLTSSQSCRMPRCGRLVIMSFMPSSPRRQKPPRAAPLKAVSRHNNNAAARLGLRRLCF